MGLFSSKTKYYVASQIYNLAGDNLSERVPYMKSLVIQSALLGGDVSKRISNGILVGPGFQLKNFHRWANTNYIMGLPTADLTADVIGSLNTVAGQIPIPSGSPAGTFVVPMSAVITDPDSQLWAEKYLLENHPNLLEKVWTVDQDDISDQITISFADSTPNIVFTPVPWDTGARYVACRYAFSYPAINGAREALGRVGPFRSVSGARLTGYVEYARPAPIPNSFTLVRRVTTHRVYSNGQPPVHDVTETSQVMPTETVRVNYRKETNRGFVPGTQRPDILVEEKEVIFGHEKLKRYTRETINGVNYVETQTIEEDYLADAIYYDSFQRVNQGSELGREHVFLYRLGGSNPVLNAIKVDKGQLNEFLPMLPVRINNKFINEAPWEDGPVDKAVSKAYKRIYKDKIKTLIEELEDNDDVDDIDFAFLVFGITLNERDPAGKKYIYEFLKGLIQYQESSKTEVEGYDNYINTQRNYEREYARWRKIMEERGFSNGRAPTRPTMPMYPPPKQSSFILDANIPDMPWYKITFKWSYIHETFGMGAGKQGAKPGDVWWALAPVIRNPSPVDTSGDDDKSIFVKTALSRVGGDSRKGVYLYHQIDRFTYRRLEIVGFEHSNYVYKNKSVVHQLYNAVKDVDAIEESPVFFPLHMPTLKVMTVKDQNQIGGCSRLLMLNCYVKKKIRWYQRGIFKVIFMIAIIVARVILSPATVGASIGLLGSNLAVGTALGLVGSAAIIAGAALNMIAATVLTSMIQRSATSLFGDKWGQIIGAVASFFAMKIGTTFAATGSLSINWSQMFNADNLMNLTSAISSGYTGFMNIKIQELQEDYEKLSDEYKDQVKLIEERAMELFGQSAWIDPMMFTEMGKEAYGDTRESSETFLTRTLLTGSDIAELSLAAISEFPNASLEIPEAIV